jgi:hypothetical protein
MGRGKSKERLAMGEEAWAERRKKQNREKVNRYLKKNPKAKAKKRNYVSEWRRKKKRELIEYKGGKCQRCGYNKDVLGAYAFHHRDPSEKEFSISRYQKLNTEALYKEVDKCDLLCQNCHAEVHEEERKSL